MEIGDKVVLRIQGLLNEKGITLNKLSTLSGVNQSTLNNIMSRTNECPNVKTIDLICEYGFEITLEEFFKSSSFK